MKNAFCLIAALLAISLLAHAQVVTLKPSDAGLRVEIDGQFFTEYVTKDTPRHIHPRRTDERIHERSRRVLGDILGEELPINLDTQSGIAGIHRDGLRVQRGQRREQQGGQQTEDLSQELFREKNSGTRSFGDAATSQPDACRPA